MGLHPVIGGRERASSMSSSMLAPDLRLDAFLPSTTSSPAEDFRTALEVRPHLFLTDQP